MNRPQALIYVESLLGVGHGVRAAAVTRAMLQRGFDVTLVSGSQNLNGQELRGAKVVHLPMVRAADARFSRLVDETGRELGDDLRDRRRTALLEAYRTALPQIIVIEGFPFFALAVPVRTDTSDRGSQRPSRHRLLGSRHPCREARSTAY